jgi:hypothetical protein
MICYQTYADAAQLLLLIGICLRSYVGVDKTCWDSHSLPLSLSDEINIIN